MKFLSGADTHSASHYINRFVFATFSSKCYKILGRNVVIIIIIIHYVFRLHEAIISFSDGDFIRLATL